MIRFGFKSLSIEIKRWRVRPLHRLQYSSLEQSKDFQELFSLIGDLNTWNKTSCCVKTAKWPFPHHQCPPSYLSALESGFPGLPGMQRHRKELAWYASLSHFRLGDPCVIRARASYLPRKQKQSAAKINKGSRCGFFASDEPRPSSPEYTLEPNLCRYSPLP
jgi:hypothetical protein